MIKKVLFLLLFPFQVSAFTIPEDLIQGMFVFGTAEPDETIFYEDIKVPVHDGKYVFALGRNAPEEIRITVKKGWFKKQVLTFPVKKGIGKQMCLMVFLNERLNP